MKLGLTRQYIRTTRLSGNCLGQSMWLHVPEEEKEKKRSPSIPGPECLTIVSSSYFNLIKVDIGRCAM